MTSKDKLVEEFRKRYMKEFGDKITESEAHELFMRIVDLVRLVMRD